MDYEIPSRKQRERNERKSDQMPKRQSFMEACAESGKPLQAAHNPFLAELKMEITEPPSERVKEWFQAKPPCGACGSEDYVAACWRGSGEIKCTDCAPGELCRYCGEPGPSCCASCETKGYSK